MPKTQLQQEWETRIRVSVKYFPPSNLLCTIG